MKYVLFYQSAPDVRSKAPLHFAANSARWAEFQSRGILLITGTSADPQAEGSMAVFSTREDAEEFATGNPFLLNGVVDRWFIREWNEVLFHP